MTDRKEKNYIGRECSVKTKLKKLKIKKLRNLRKPNNYEYNEELIKVVRKGEWLKIKIYHVY